MIITDLSKEFYPVPKNKRIIDKKKIDDKTHNCEYCLKKNCWTNKHHVKTKGTAGNDTDDNLIELCGTCHRKAHDGVISKEELITIINRRNQNDRSNKCKTN